MRLIAEVLAYVVSYYLTIGIMGVGFGTMFAGKDGAGAAAEFFFLRPLQWAGRHLWFAGAALVGTSLTFVLHRVVDPFILAVERAVIRLFTRERGWIQLK